MEDPGRTICITATEHGDVQVVKMSGRLTIGCVNEADSFLTGLLSAGGGRFVLDLSDLTHVVSSGIGVLIAFRERTKKTGGALAIGGVHPRIMKIFQLMSLDAFFPIFESVERALSSFRPGGK